MVEAGAARVDVDVPVGTPLAGYAARTSGSTGTLDPLSVRALVVDDHALVTIDCVALHEDTCATIRALCPCSDVVVTATHTHAGPTITPRGMGRWASTVHDAVVEAAAAAVRQASRSRERTELVYGERAGTGVGANRRHPDRATDLPVQIVGFRRADRTWVASLTTFPAHPVVLDASNTDVSADYPGSLRDRVEDALPGSVALFATGCAGDVNDSAHPPSASFSTEPQPGRTHAAATRTGRAIADVALAALRDGRTAHGVVKAWSNAPVELDVIPEPPHVLRASLDQWRAERAAVPATAQGLLDLWIDWAEDRLREPTTLAVWHGRVTLWRWGEIAVAALPCEPFWWAAEEIRTFIPGALVLGYADGVAGYLPPLNEIPLGGYEVSDAHRYYGLAGPFAAGSLEQVVNTVRALDSLQRCRTMRDHALLW